MKKLILALLAVVVLALAGGLGYLVLNEDALGQSQQVDGPAADASSGSQESTAPAAAEPARRIGDTAADRRDALVGDYEQNRDTVGWLQIDGTTINDSVVQAHDNLYYLRRDVNRKESVYGCYYADYECSFGSRDELSQNTVIYGHSDLKDNPEGPKFSQLFRFADVDFAKKHSTISFSTLEESMTWEIFAVFYTDTRFDYIRADYTQQGFVGLLSGARERSIYDYAAKVGPNDKILTLSTCAVKYGEDENQRFVVMARLLPAEAKAPATAELDVNPNPVTPGVS